MAFNSNKVSYLREPNTACSPSPLATLLQIHTLRLDRARSGCCSSLGVKPNGEQLAARSRAAGRRLQGMLIHRLRVRRWGILGQTTEGWRVSEDKAGGCETAVVLFNRAAIKHFQINRVCAGLEREGCDLLPLCHAQHTGDGRAKGPRTVSIHRTNQYIMLQICSVPLAGVILRKQEVCMEICSPEKLHALQTHEFLGNPRPAEAGGDLWRLPSRSPTRSGASQRRVLQALATVTTHVGWGCGDKPCQVGLSNLLGAHLPPLTHIPLQQ